MSKVIGASEDSNNNLLKTFIPPSGKMTLKLDNLIDSTSFEKWPKTEKENNEEKTILQTKLIDLYV
jgi:LEA14-like dessication related protein